MDAFADITLAMAREQELLRVPFVRRVFNSADPTPVARAVQVSGPSDGAR
jgi:hypothetical protein